MLGLQVDTARLFANADPGYLVWLAGLVDKIHQTKQAIAEQQRRDAKKKPSGR